MWTERGSRAACLAVLVIVALAAGCASQAGTPRIRLGAFCAACGMPIRDPSFACGQMVGRRWRTFDSIECLLREVIPGEPAWLADYDTRTLHAADSVWVVRGEFPSPMGGGFAGFLDRAAADDIASRTRGRVARFATFCGTAPGGSGE